MDTTIDADGLLALLGAIFLLARGYAAIFAPYQEEFAEAIFQWFDVPSQRKPIINFVIGTAVAALLTGLVAVYIDDWRLMAVSLVAGFFSSTDAAKTHDDKQQYSHGWQDAERTLVRRRSSLRPSMEE